MTDEQINLAIHKAVGFEWNDDRKLWERHARRVMVVSHNPLHYSSDLNAMHLTEKILSDAQWEDYIDYLANDWGRLPDPWKEVCRSTARQRAEAFLRTLGKWEEVQK